MKKEPCNAPRIIRAELLSALSHFSHFYGKFECSGGRYGGRSNCRKGNVFYLHFKSWEQNKLEHQKTHFMKYELNNTEYFFSFTVKSIKY